jgi:outer membrane protein OmpA-like peptidoglycan-associated protein
MPKLVKKDELVDKKPREDSASSALNSMKKLLPLTLYFHNDEPNPKSTATKTDKNYQTTYSEYKGFQKDYYSEYPKNLSGEEKENAIKQLNLFFRDSVDAGMMNLEKFAILLNQVMKKGQKVKISLKGFCSPLATTNYNINLAKRRVSSVENYFKDYNNGVFVKYINNKNPNEGGIEFTEEDIGELTGSKVSDDLKDKRNSVYSPNAGVERKIKVLSIGLLKE